MCGKELYSVLLTTNQAVKRDGPVPVEMPILTASGKTIKLRMNEAVAIRDEVVGIVTQSGGTSGLVNSEMWPVFLQSFNEKMDALEKRMEKLPELQKEVLQQHEIERTAKERTAWNRSKRVIEKLVWIGIGAVLARLIVLWLFGH